MFLKTNQPSTEVFGNTHLFMTKLNPDVENCEAAEKELEVILYPTVSKLNV